MQSKFSLTAEGALSFKVAKDFEAPEDANTDGEYEVTVRVTDGANPVDAALVVQLDRCGRRGAGAVERVGRR